MRLRFRYSVIVGRVLVLIQVGSASPRRRQAHAPLTEPFNYTRKTKLRTEGEAAAKPLGGLSPFFRRERIFIFKPSITFKEFQSDGRICAITSGETLPM